MIISQVKQLSVKYIKLRRFSLKRKEVALVRKEVNITCKVCNKEFKTIFSFTGHLRNHSMTSKQYYDTFIKEDGEGICPTCGKQTNFKSFTEGYHKFCSISCLNKSDYIKEKSREASMRKWGVPHQLQSKEFKQQLMDKNMEKYGYTWKIETPEMREKITNSVQEKYGVDNVFADETVKKKLRKTQEEKYGGIGAGSPITKAKMEETNIRKYGVENVFASEEVVEKLHDIREEWIEKCEQENDVTLGMKLFEKFGTGFMQAKVVEPIIHNGSRFYRNSDIPYIEKCAELAKNNNVSLVEADVRCFVSSIFNIKTNIRNIIPPYELDIFVPDKKLAIEINGVYWHSTNRGKPKDAKLKKTIKCEKQSIQLIHINEFEWKNKRGICKSILLSALGIYETNINVDDCEIKEVSLPEANEFLDKNHIQGSISSSSYQLGIYHEGELVQLVTFNNDGKYAELLRVGTKLNTNIVGGFDRLMRTQPFNVVHSFVDRSKFTCDKYLKCGWKVCGETSPSYCYYKGDNCFSSQQEQELAQSLGTDFDKNKTFEQNLIDNKYLQVYDCGSFEVLYRKELIDESNEQNIIY